VNIQTNVCDTLLLGHDQLLSYVALNFEFLARSLTYEICELELVGPSCLAAGDRAAQDKAEAFSEASP
jgi:hypothetical protein